VVLRFFIFRHGETDWNSLKKFQGHTDIPLNSKGESQALILAEKIKKLQLKVVLCSDLLRARRTAEIALGENKVPFHIHAELRETHLGHAEGLTPEEIDAKFGENIVARWKSIASEEVDFCFPGGEKKSDHLKRLHGVLETYAHSEKHGDRDQIGVSTHGGSLVRLVHASDGSPTTAITIPNCVMYELEYSLITKRWKFVGEVL